MILVDPRVVLVWPAEVFYEYLFLFCFRVNPSLQDVLDAEDGVGLLFGSYLLQLLRGKRYRPDDPLRRNLRDDSVEVVFLWLLCETTPVSTEVSTLS